MISYFQTSVQLTGNMIHGSCGKGLKGLIFTKEKPTVRLSVVFLKPSVFVFFPEWD